MRDRAKVKSARKGFTLVEILVVIVIIGILAALLVAAVQRARVTSRNSIIKVEIGQLEMALDSFKGDYGDYPPDPTDSDAVTRFLRKAFPRYTPTNGALFGGDPVADGRPNTSFFDQFANDVYYAYNGKIDPQRFDQASALVFWLGGLPEDPNANTWVPAGFHADPACPVRPGLPRLAPQFDFVAERVVAVEPHPDAPNDPARERYLRYYPDHTRTPYVFFRAKRILGKWQYKPAAASAQLVYLHSDGNDADPTNDNRCVPYQMPDGAGSRWVSENKYQIIAAGLDDKFGAAPPTADRITGFGDGFTDGDYDNLTNFAKSKLGDTVE